MYVCMYVFLKTLNVTHFKKSTAVLSNTSKQIWFTIVCNCMLLKVNKQYVNETCVGV